MGAINRRRSQEGDLGDPVFFPPPAALTLADVLDLTGARIIVPADPDRPFRELAALDRAGPASISILGDDRVPEIAATRAGACFVDPAQVQTGRAAHLPAHTLVLLVPDGGRALATLAARLYPDAGRPGSIFATRGISPAAFIHSEARLEPDVIIDPGVVIGPRAEIGAGTLIGANSVVGPEVRIGRDCSIGPQVTITHALIGNGVTIRPGVRIGQDGADWSGDAAGRAPGPALGRVIVQDRVDIGANSTIDRGGLRDTVLGEDSRIGGLVHVRGDRTVARHAVVGGSGPAGPAGPAPPD